MLLSHLCLEYKVLGVNKNRIFYKEMHSLSFVGSAVIKYVIFQDEYKH